jgi:hypothetical protein
MKLKKATVKMKEAALGLCSRVSTFLLKFLKILKK